MSSDGKIRAPHEVRFREYREYERRRVEASDGMMALLAGAQLASHLLQLHEGSDRLLPEVFPKVAHIARFNLTSERAREILRTADVHLGAMSVPYALAIHEDFLRSCLGLLESVGRCSASTVSGTPLARQHSAIQSATGGTFDKDNLAIISTLRLMRNCTIHSGGRASVSLIQAITDWDPPVEHEWSRLAQRNPRHLRRGDVVQFSHGELILTLAVTKRLGREANQLLQTACSPAMWADMVVTDLLVGDPAAARRSDLSRKVRGLARFNYSAVALTDDDLDRAIQRMRGA